ncbi:Dihydromonapterin reductase [Dirofilaria immitis]
MEMCRRETDTSVKRIADVCTNLNELAFRNDIITMTYDFRKVTVLRLFEEYGTSLNTLLQFLRHLHCNNGYLNDGINKYDFVFRLHSGYKNSRFISNHLYKTISFGQMWL